MTMWRFSLWQQLYISSTSRFIFPSLSSILNRYMDMNIGSRFRNTKFIIVIPKQFHFVLWLHFTNNIMILPRSVKLVWILLLSFSLIINFSKPRSKTISKLLVVLCHKEGVPGQLEDHRYFTKLVLAFAFYIFCILWLPTKSYLLRGAPSKLITDQKFNSIFNSVLEHLSCSRLNDVHFYFPHSPSHGALHIIDL